MQSAVLHRESEKRDTIHLSISLLNIDRFLAYMLSPVRPSVCLSVTLYVRLSVTRVDQSKTVEVRIMQHLPQSSPMTLVF